MKVQLANPSEHPQVAALPFSERLEDWSIPNVHDVGGIHRHVVRLVEFPHGSYVIKELPDRLALREYRLLKELDEAGLPTAEVVGVMTGRKQADGMIITKYLEYSIPYRSLLRGRGLEIPYIGDRVLDAMVSLLVRVHLAGFYWGDCSLMNTLFRRDAGALSAYIIDLETGEGPTDISDGQRALDVEIAVNNMAGGLLDLQAAGRLAEGIDPIQIALNLETNYEALWKELTEAEDVHVEHGYRLNQRIERLHELGFDVGEIEVVGDEDSDQVRFVPRVVEHGYHQEKLQSLTGLVAQENQARKLLGAIHEFGMWMESETGRKRPENVHAVRWLDQKFEPTIEKVPEDLLNKLEPVELYVQLLEHRWLMSEKAGRYIPTEEALVSYLADILEPAESDTRPEDDDADHAEHEAEDQPAEDQEAS